MTTRMARKQPTLTRGERLLLNKAYNTPESEGFQGSRSRLSRVTKIKSAKKIDQFLKEQISYVRHAQVGKRSFSKIYAPTPRYLFECDLADMSSLRKANDNVTFLLGVIDVFTKQAWVLPLLNKTQTAVTKAMSKILSQSGPSLHLRCDAGKEFVNALFQNLMKKHKINFYLAKRLPYKAAVIERYWRTLKMRLSRYMTQNNTRRYVHVLQRVVAGYNDTIHSSTGHRPKDVMNNDKVIASVYQKLYGKERVGVANETKFKVGDRVHMLINRNKFRQGYKPLFTRHDDQITKVASHHPPFRYNLLTNTNRSYLEWELRKRSVH